MTSPNTIISDMNAVETNLRQQIAHLNDEIAGLKSDVAYVEKQRDELVTENERLEEKVENANLVSQLTDAWLIENNKKIPWGKLVELVAVIEKLPNEERDRLLCLDFPDVQGDRDKLLAAAEAIETNSEECLDFDECTAMLVPIDDFHNLTEAIAIAKGMSP